MVINLALQDGFEDDTVVVFVDGVEAYRCDGLTTRTEISFAGSARLEVPEAPLALDVEVPTRGLSERIEVDPTARANVALSLRDGQLVATFPERIGFV